MLRQVAVAAVAALMGCQPGSMEFSSPANLAGADTAASDTHAHRIRRVAARIVQAVGDDCAGQSAVGASQARSCRFRIVIADTSSIVAAASAEQIRVSIGFSAFAQSDAELAFVIAHEAGHVVLAHAPGADIERRRRNELEADRLGVVLMVRAGYDGAAAATLLQRMAGSHAFQGADPPLEVRIETVRAALAGARQAGGR